MTAPDLQALVQSAQAPIAAPLPSLAESEGEAANADLEWLDSELGKLESISGGIVDWPGVQQRAVRLLSERVKDLKIGAWLVLARTRHQGALGLLTGLAELTALCDSHWDTMQPPARRARGRAKRIRWLVSELDEFVGTQPFKAEDQEALTRAVALAGKLEGALESKLGPEFENHVDQPLVPLLKRALDRLPRAEPPPPAAVPPPTAQARAEPPGQAPERGPSPAAAPSPATTALAPPASPPGKKLEPEARLKASLAECVDVARELVAREPTDPRGYRLSRLALWLPVVSTPPAEQGQTRIRGPGGEGQKLQRLREASEWSKLLSRAEQAGREYRLWLDPQRLSVEALTQLGSAHADAAAAVTECVGALVKRLPSLPGLSFQDGTPFADPTTLAWLEDLAQPTGGAPPDPEQEELEARFAQAQALVASGKVPAGLGLATRVARRGSSERERFMAQLETAELALVAGEADLARVLGAELRATGEARSLATWEPDLCARACVLELRALGRPPEKSKIAEPEGVKEARRSAFTRLASLNPEAALKWR